MHLSGTGPRNGTRNPEFVCAFCSSLVGEQAQYDRAIALTVISVEYIYSIASVTEQTWRGLLTATRLCRVSMSSLDISRFIIYRPECPQTSSGDGLYISFARPSSSVALYPHTRSIFIVATSLKLLSRFQHRHP